MKTYSHRHGFRTWQGKHLFLMSVLKQWQEGLLARAASKILRRANIHPWSLAAYVPYGDLERLIREFRLPKHIWGACLHQVGLGFGFQGIAGLFDFPNRLVMHYLHLERCDGIRSLPRRLWAQEVTVEKCPRIEVVFSHCPGLHRIKVNHCPRLRRVSGCMEEGGHLTLVDCPVLKELPAVRRLGTLHLKDLPTLMFLGNVCEVDHMSIWRLPSIRILAGLKVNHRLVIQDCQSLRRLPDVDPEIQGCVLDCPSLVDQTFAPGPWAFPVESCHPSFMEEPAPRLPRVKDVSQSQLPGFCEPPCDPAWPWPPRGVERGALDEGIERTSKALGLRLLDRIHLHLATSHSMANTIRALLLRETSPVRAVRVGARILEQALAMGDEQTAHLACLEAERLGLGALSLGLAAQRHHFQVSLQTMLGPFWGARADNSRMSSSHHPHWHHSTGVPGPLVLDRLTHIAENTELHWLEGPIWSGLSLWLSDCPRLESLPDIMVSNYSLTIESCPRLVTFPKRLDVGRDLTLRNLPRLHAWECRIRVGGKVEVENCPGLKLLPLDTP